VLLQYLIPQKCSGAFELAPIGTGLFFTAYNLRLIFTILPQIKLKAYLEKLYSFFYPKKNLSELLTAIFGQINFPSMKNPPILAWP